MSTQQHGDVDNGTSRVVKGRRPAPGTDPIADAIRERRGARGITPLDANLLHVPPIANGFNTLLGAIRTKGKLPGDVREGMILRVAALNHAAFEWIHHEPIARKEGLTTGQLYLIRDVDTPLLEQVQNPVLTPLQNVSIAFTDFSTRGVQVPFDIIQKFKEELRNSISSAGAGDEEVTARVEDLFVEASMVVAAYNMVSRFLLASDVAGMADSPVPWPVERTEHFVDLPSYDSASSSTHRIHAITLISSPSSPWIVFANSLLSDLTAWSYILPHLLGSYNILIHSQRGHGRSTLPSSPPPSSADERLTTIPLLAQDISNLLNKLSIPTPIHAVIGCSQGGAAALAFAAYHGTQTKSIIACGTAPTTPAGNKQAWAERIKLASGETLGLGLGGSTTTPISQADKTKVIRNVGMPSLSAVTIPRWFPQGSPCHPLPASSPTDAKRIEWIGSIVSRTPFEGFVQGALALSDYDLLPDLLASKPEPKVLLLAGALDGNGKVGQGLQNLQQRWAAQGVKVDYIQIENAGHLSMVDSPAAFGKAVGEWLKGV